MGSLLSRAHPPAAPISPLQKSAASPRGAARNSVEPKQEAEEGAGAATIRYDGSRCMNPQSCESGGSSGVTTQQSSSSSLLAPEPHEALKQEMVPLLARASPAPRATGLEAVVGSSVVGFRAPSPTSCGDLIDESRALEGWVPPFMYERVDAIDALYRFGECIGRGLDSVVFKGANVAESTAKAMETCEAGCGSLDGRLSSASERQSRAGSVAIKVLQKRRLLNKEGRKMHKLRMELSIWQKLRHPSIIALQAVSCAGLTEHLLGEYHSPIFRLAQPS